MALDRLAVRAESRQRLRPSERHSLMPVSWSADHRVVDGASLASMSARWKHLVENPHELLASLK